MLWCLEDVLVPAEPSKEAGAGFTSQGFSCDLNSEIQIDKAPYTRTDSASQGELFVPVSVFHTGFLSIRQE